MNPLLTNKKMAEAWRRAWIRAQRRASDETNQFRRAELWQRAERVERRFVRALLRGLV